MLVGQRGPVRTDVIVIIEV
jgi:myo-inositol-hexaphosphate 3-phosphohydrolase